VGNYLIRIVLHDFEIRLGPASRPLAILVQIAAIAMGAHDLHRLHLRHTAGGAWKLALVERPRVHGFGSVPMFASEHHPTGSRAPSRRKTSLAGPL
jgi:hypothetical protein